MANPPSRCWHAHMQNLKDVHGAACNAQHCGPAAPVQDTIPKGAFVTAFVGRIHTAREVIDSGRDDTYLYDLHKRLDHTWENVDLGEGAVDPCAPVLAPAQHPLTPACALQAVR